MGAAAALVAVKLLEAAAGSPGGPESGRSLLAREHGEVLEDSPHMAGKIRGLSRIGC